MQSFECASDAPRRDERDERAAVVHRIDEIAAYFEASLEHEAGEALPRTIEELRAKAEAGDARAQRALGLVLHVGRGAARDFIEAVSWYERSAASDPVAKVMLGICHEFGQGVDEDPKRAAALYRESAEQGNAKGQCYLARCFGHGIGVAQDSVQAVHWLRLAAEQGESWAQVQLAWQLQVGEGVAKDEAAAGAWLRRASDRGSVDAIWRLGECYANGRGVAVDLAEARALFLRAAELGSPTAQSLLARCYERGTGVRKDLNEAARWYSRAVEGGDIDAHAAVGWLMVKGNGVEKKVERGLSLLRYASSKGHRRAGVFLAYCLCGGAGMQADYQQAIPLLRQLTVDDDGYSSYLLGLCHLHGHGVPRDFAAAHDLFARSAALGYAPARQQLRILPFEKHAVLRYRHTASMLLGWSLLVAYAWRTPATIDALAIGKYLGLVLFLGTAVLALLVLVPRGMARLRADLDEYPDPAPIPFWRLVLGVPAEDGLFLVPLLCVGVSPVSAAVAALLFGVAHYPHYPWITCIPKAAAYFAAIMWILPYGIWTMIAGHLLLDLLVEFPKRLSVSVR